MEKNCKHKRYILSGMLLLMASSLSAQTSEYDRYAGWYKQWNDSLRGANIIGAQRVLQAHKAKKKQKVVVGVIDSGADTTCVALRPVLWTNPKEKFNGRDDDHNGYVDDVHGWN